jgi:hypothetical protein
VRGGEFASWILILVSHAINRVIFTAYYLLAIREKAYFTLVLFEKRRSSVERRRRDFHRFIND